MWHSCCGYVMIQVQGSALERFVNRALSQHVHFADVKRTGPSEMTMRVSARDFLKKLPAVRRGCRCRIHILRRCGIPFFVWKVWRRKALLFGFLAGMAGLMAASSRIWHIRIQGCYQVPETVVYNALSDAGVYRGMPRSGIMNHDLAGKIAAFDQRIAWAGVSEKGVILQVEVVEAEPLPQPEAQTGPVDVVAKRDAIVEKVTATTGKAAVREGDAVRQGQVLIRGDITREDGEKQVLVHAEGQVLARVWYYAEVTLEQQAEVYLPNGNTAPYTRIAIGPWTLYETPSRFEHNEIRQHSLTRIDRLVLPLRYTRGEQLALMPTTIRRPQAELEAEAMFQAELQAMSLLPKDAALVEKQLSTFTREDGSVTGRAGVCVLEQIGEQRPIEGPEPPA